MAAQQITHILLTYAISAWTDSTKCCTTEDPEVLVQHVLLLEATIWALYRK